MSKELNLFEVATRERYRFPYRGQISVEDLWVLSVEELDKIYVVLDSEMEKSNTKSLLSKKTKENEELANKITIVKHIVSVKLEEAEQRVADKARREEKQKLMKLIEEKKDAALGDMSVEELERKLAELG